MKRKIALLILIILALSVALVACNQTPTTNILTRWENETHVFKITLADFALNYENATDPFNFYDANGNKTVRTDYNANSVYSKDIAFSNEFYNRDEIKPLDASGTYTINITPSGDKSECTVDTTQIIYVKYSLKTDTVSGVDFEKYNALRSAEASESEYTAAGLTKEDGTTILKTTPVTKVNFENNPSQTPLTSYINVVGFYIGKDNKNDTEAQQLSKYEIETEYDYSGKKPIAKMTITTDDGTDTAEYEFPKNSAGNFIDSNQIIMYLRSLDKSSSSFLDNPTKSVFNPYTRTIKAARFGLTYEYNVLLTDYDHDDSFLATKLNIVTVTVGNNTFMMQENLPDKLLDKDLDRCFIVDDKESKFTTVRFRVGYFSYEIAYSNKTNTTDWNEIWTALTPAAPEQPEE